MKTEKQIVRRVRLIKQKEATLVDEIEMLEKDGAGKGRACSVARDRLVSRGKERLELEWVLV